MINLFPKFYGEGKSPNNDTKKDKNNFLKSMSKKTKGFLKVILLLVAVLILEWQIQPVGLLYAMFTGVAWLLMFVLLEKIWESFLTGRNLMPPDFNNEERYNEYEAKGYSENKCITLLNNDCRRYDNKKYRGTKLSIVMRATIGFILAFILVYAIKFIAQ